MDLKPVSNYHKGMACSCAIYEAVNKHAVIGREKSQCVIWLLGVSPQNTRMFQREILGMGVCLLIRLGKAMRMCADERGRNESNWMPWRDPGLRDAEAIFWQTIRGRKAYPTD